MPNRRDMVVAVRLATVLFAMLTIAFAWEALQSHLLHRSQIEGPARMRWYAASVLIRGLFASGAWIAAGAMALFAMRRARLIVRVIAPRAPG